VWEGFIFVNLDAEGTQTLPEYLGPVYNRVRDLPFGSYPYSARIGAEIGANWKLAIEAQCEAYHVRALHARTVSKMLSSKDNPYVHSLDAQVLGAHRMQSVPRNPEYDLSPEKLVQAFSFTNVAPITAEAERGVGLNKSFAGHPDINTIQSNVWNNDQYVLFPNFIVHAAMGGWWLHRFWPLAADKTYWEAVYHFEKPKNLRAVFATQYALALNRDTLMEDNLALVQQQQVLGSGAKKVAQFGDQEALCKHLAAVFEASINDTNYLMAAE
jgi:phenylpropionate dioxygenase-like ring-hydroxylating dioxygenase large terminal subunit